MRVISIVIVLSFASIASAQQPPPDAAPHPPEAPPPPPEPEVTPAKKARKQEPEPIAAAAPPAPRVDDKQLSVTYDKGLTFAAPNDKLKLKITFRNQLRFESTRPTEDNSQFASHFLIPRARMQVEGQVFDPTTRFRLELGVGDSGSFSFVRDLFVDQRVSPAPVWIRAGVWKRPFNRQELVSDFASEFNERAITATFVGGGRDLGLAVHNDYEKSPEGIEWAAGIFNSFNGGKERPDIGGCTTTMMVTACPPPANFPADFAPAVVVHAGWNHGDIKGYSEGDLDGGALRYAVGAAYKIDLGNFAKQKEESASENLSHGVQVDAMVKVEGTSIELGAYMMKLPASKASNKSADAGFGAFGQIGYFVMPKRFQICGRFAIAPDAKTVDRNQIEARAALNLYWQGHAWKWATDVGVLKTTGEDPMTMAKDKADVVIRSMLQLVL